MITCSICSIENDDLATLCVSCRSYLQSKVDNLDLFETIWQLIDDPGAAFKKIVMSSHKNYTVLLSSLFGISLTVSVFWMKNLGPTFLNLLTLAGSAGLLGIPLGLLFVLVLSFVCVRVAGILGKSVTVRNTASVVSYASTPLIFSLVFVLPIEIAVFGIDFFGVNPPPIVINPVVYVALLGFNALAILWSMLLLFRGLTVLTGFARVKSIALTGVTFLVPGMLLTALKYL